MNPISCVVYINLVYVYLNQKLYGLSKMCLHYFCKCICDSVSDLLILSFINILATALAKLSVHNQSEFNKLFFLKYIVGIL